MFLTDIVNKYPSCNKESESTMDPVMQQDIEMIADCIKEFKELHNSTIFITGTTGLIGQQIVRAFLCSNRLYQTNIRIIAHARNEKKFRELYANVLERENLEYLISDIQTEIPEEIKCDYIIHGAGITGNPKRHVEHPTITINTALLGTHNILEMAKRNKIKGMVYMSSWEVYGITDSKKDEIFETDYGYIDLSIVRRCHGESKRMSECMCVGYASEFDIPVAMGRIPLTFGPGVMDTDNRVFAQFGRSVINKSDIILHTDGQTMRNHCYIADVIRALLFIMVKGEKGQSYNIVNPDTFVSIVDMANLVSHLFDDAKIKVRIELEDESKFGYNPKVICKLNSDKLQRLGWKPKYDLKEMYMRMIASMYFDWKGKEKKNEHK